MVFRETIESCTAFGEENLLVEGTGRRTTAVDGVSAKAGGVAVEDGGFDGIAGIPCPVPVLQEMISL